MQFQLIDFVCAIFDGHSLYFQKFEVTITYKLQLQIVDESLSLRTRDTIIEEIIDLFEYVTKRKLECVHSFKNLTYT